MPPKQKPSDKNRAMAKTKSAEDKTFGLKNKNKSKKVQQQIHQIKAGVDGGAQAKKEAEAKRRANEKRAQEEAMKEAAALFAILPQKVPFGIDPKLVLCEFFKAGVCTKGSKCKFSHDPMVGRKDAKKDLYTDARTEKEVDTMEEWDEEKLRLVISSKHGNPQTTTDIICKFFIDAVENGKYGWFWTCPNGGNECKYRHSLPHGFVLKTKEQKRLERLAADNAPNITLEEFIELERSRLDRTKLTPINAATFSMWKAKQTAIKVEEKRNEQERSKAGLTGRELILKKFADKFYLDEEDEGDQWDLSQFTKVIDEGESGENYKDYGDGTIVLELYQQEAISV